MSPSGENLCNWCRNFPGLVNNTYIDWLFPWPSQALLAVAHVYLTDVSGAVTMLQSYWEVLD